VIVVKVELWPGGYESHAKEIGRLLIHNTTYARDAKRGNYAIRLLRKGSLKTVRRVAEVLDHPRLSADVWNLIRKALVALDV
jgi:hypothetical protein